MGTYVPLCGQRDQGRVHDVDLSGDAVRSGSLPEVLVHQEVRQHDLIQFFLVLSNILFGRLARDESGVIYGL